MPKYKVDVTGPGGTEVTTLTVDTGSVAVASKTAVTPGGSRTFRKHRTLRKKYKHRKSQKQRK